jgi:hypothetical protein
MKLENYILSNMKKSVVLNKLPGESFVSPYGNKTPTHLTQVLQKPEVSKT